MSQGQLIAGASAVLLFIFTFLPWYGAEGVDSANLWEYQNPYDVFILLTVVVALAAVLTARGRGLVFPGFTLNGATAVLGTTAALTILWHLIEFPEGLDRKIGLFLSLLAAIGVAYGAWTAAQDEAVVAGDTTDRY